MKPGTDRDIQTYQWLRWYLDEALFWADDLGGDWVIVLETLRDVARFKETELISKRLEFANTEEDNGNDG